MEFDYLNARREILGRGASATVRLSDSINLILFDAIAANKGDFWAKTLEGHIPCRTVETLKETLWNKLPWLHVLLNGFDPRYIEEIVKIMGKYDRNFILDNQVISTIFITHDTLLKRREAELTMLSSGGIRAENKTIRNLFFGTAAKTAARYDFSLEDWFRVLQEYSLLDPNILADREQLIARLTGGSAMIRKIGKGNFEDILRNPELFAKIVEEGRGNIYNKYILGMPKNPRPLTS
jgi:hypothetical protein